MKNKWAMVFCMISILMIQNVIAQTDGKIIVQADQKGATVSPSMYGVFFEEINHAGEGGLYAELVQNRGFEENEYPAGYTVKYDKLYPPPAKNHLNGEVNTDGYRWHSAPIPGWSILSNGPAKSSMKLTRVQPLDLETPNNLELSMPAKDGVVSLQNSGFWGMGVKAGDKYNLRFYLRAPGYNGTVKVSLLSATGKEIATAPMRIVNTAGWHQYRADFIAGATDAKATLAITFNGGGTVWLDYVSLFPEKTFHNRPNGLRADVAGFLADLHPGFMRWPGGCVVEGITVHNRFEWKKTMGDPLSRRGEYDTWGYRNTYGFGYHEYLQFCEDIGAKAMFVCNVGLGCQYRMGDACSNDSVQYYINDVLDAIDYAIGDKATTWGAKRFATGHPAPFPLTYIEIGNENWGPVYNERFDLFYAAIKAKYPQLTLISNHGLGNEVKKIKKTDMIDPHWYVAPDYFFNNADIFDKSPRGEHSVYVGEYACNQGVGGGNMLAALSEAAFITGMERNSDLVKMASYAPLFENRNDRTWPVNLIWIDNLQVVGRSSYYVQQMMGDNLPSWNLPAQVTPRPTLPGKTDADGAVGVGTWVTQAEYKDVKITAANGNVQHPALKDLVKQSEGWTITDSLAKQQSDASMAAAVFNTPVTGDYTLELKARKTGGNEGFLVLFGITDDNKKGYLVNIGGWGNTLTAIERVANGTTSRRFVKTGTRPC